LNAPGAGIAKAELLERIRKAVDAEPLDRAAALGIAASLERAPEELLEPLLEAGQELGRRGHGDRITVSRNVFIPLTNLCRNRCSYCGFARGPESPEARTYSLEEVGEISRKACAAGCQEALFCLGDKPEAAHRTHRAWLGARGYSSTAQYLVDACKVSCELGMFPHVNAGVMTFAEMRALRSHSASMGIMLETTSQRLREPGQVHAHSPDKDPERRVAMVRSAGLLRVPFTTGMLIGIGETPPERVDTLLQIRTLQAEGGHIQEVIVQGFHPKPGTEMAQLPTPSEQLLAGLIALARLILGPSMNLQAPPNLSPTSLALLARSGLNDWGGISPVSVDFINPEAPWPELEQLRRRTESAGYQLLERHCAYPETVVHQPELFDPEMLRRLRARSDPEGYVLAEGPQ